MKKIFYVMGLCALALGACDGKDANAQMQESMDVGSPEGANMLMLEESYTVTAPAANPTPQTNEQMEPLPGDPGVEVAPQPESPMPASDTNTPDDADDSEELIEETITTTTQGM